jgi:4-hydroxy-2-oxoheptanedioate aldolase
MTASPGFTLARKLRNGDTMFGGWCTLPYPMVTELVGQDGFPAVVLDQQHASWDTASLVAAIAAAHQAGTAPIVRIPIGDFAMASRVLDFGAAGIIAPMINNAADARALAAAAKFPPVGERSWGPQRALTFSGIADARSYLRKANDLTLAFAMIETRAALDNLDAILATSGIDGVFVGPFDLSIMLADGKNIDPESKDVDAALNKVLKAAETADKLTGVYCQSAKRARALAKRGFRFITAGTDAGFLRAGVSAVIDELKA